MKRYEEIDILKGIAVICMVIFHFFYFPNKYGFKEIEYDTTLLKTIAKVAQFIFIGCVGINLSLSSGDDKKSMKRVGKLIFLAILMSIFTYFIFGDNFVKFGILHFIAFASIILFKFVDNMKVIYILLLISILIYYLILSNQSIFSNVPDKLAFVAGFYNKNFTSFDHFPIFPWIIVVLVGVIIGNYIKNNKLLIKLPDKVKENFVFSSLKNMGQKSLEIYCVHWIILYVIYCIIYSKWMREKYITSLVNLPSKP